MKLREYMLNLAKLAEKNPEILDYEVIYTKDDEGNGFNNAHYTPSLGIFEDREFISKENIGEYEREESEINAICIN